MSVLLLGFQPEELDQKYVAQVRAAAPDMRVVVTNDRAEIESLLGEIEIAAGGFPRELLPQARALRWLQQWSAGSDWLLRHPEIAALELVITTASGVHAVPISEQIIGYLLMFARGLHRAVRAQQRGERWRPERSEVFELAGKRMLLVGVGAIGTRTALLARAHGMHVEGIRRDPTRSAEGIEAMYGQDQLRERLPHADIVVVTVPLSRETHGLIGEQELRAMRQSAYLVNIGRGATIDEAALIRALHEGWIAGAGLDVFAQEPLPPESPLWAMENVIITSHYSGITPAYDERAVEIFLDNLARYRSGQPLRNLVDKQVGY